VTQIQTKSQPSVLQGPRGIPADGLGGAYTPRGQKDIIDSDAFQGPLILLSGTSDAIDPTVSGNYIIVANASAALDAITIGAPRVGLDDNLSIAIYSDTVFAHTITGPSLSFATGAVGVNKQIITLLAGRGSGVTLRAYNGVWQVVGNSGPATFT
jgi:hypothetical protein